MSANTKNKSNDDLLLLFIDKKQGYFILSSQMINSLSKYIKSYKMDL